MWGALGPLHTSELPFLGASWVLVVLLCWACQLQGCLGLEVTGCVRSWGGQEEGLTGPACEQLLMGPKGQILSAWFSQGGGVLLWGQRSQLVGQGLGCPPVGACCRGYVAGVGMGRKCLSVPPSHHFLLGQSPAHLGPSLTPQAVSFFSLFRV